MLAPWMEGGFPLLPASVRLLLGTSNGCGFQSAALGYAPLGAEISGWKVLFTTCQRKSQWGELLDEGRTWRKGELRNSIE